MSSVRLDATVDPSLRDVSNMAETSSVTWTDTHNSSVENKYAQRIFRILDDLINYTKRTLN